VRSAGTSRPAPSQGAAFAATPSQSQTIRGTVRAHNERMRVEPSQVRAHNARVHAATGRKSAGTGAAALQAVALAYPELAAEVVAETAPHELAALGTNELGARVIRAEEQIAKSREIVELARAAERAARRALSDPDAKKAKQAQEGLDRARQEIDRAESAYA